MFSLAKTEKIIRDERVKLRSLVPDEVRTMLIHLTKDYAYSVKKYPVLYILDSKFFFRQAVSTVEFLSELKHPHAQPIPHRRKIPFAFIEIIEVSHSHVPHRTCYHGLLALFADWMIPNEMTTHM